MRNYQNVTLVLSKEILEIIMLLKRFVDVFSRLIVDSIFGSKFEIESNC